MAMGVTELIVFNPMLGDRLNYIYFSHPKPWTSNIGEVKSIRVENDIIKVKVYLEAKEARQSERWDAAGNRVIVEIRDADGRIVMGNWVDLKQSIMTFDMCLGDSNA